MNNKGFVSTISVFSIFIFCMFLILYIVKAINYNNNNKSYITNQVYTKIDNKEIFVQVVDKVR